MKRPHASNKKISSPPAEVIQVSPADQKKQLRMIALVCAIVAVLLYANTLTHGYTVDDGTVMESNKIVTKGISAIPEIFSTPYRKGFWERKDALYRPLSLVMFAIEWQIAPKQPWLGHIINVLLYGITAFALFFFMSRLMANKPPWIPFVVTLLFIVHPVHTEVVANIKSRDEILSFLFSIASCYSLVRYVQESKRSQIVASAGWYLLALFSKESAITLFAVFPLMIWFFTKKTWKEIIPLCTPYAGVAALFLVIRFMVLKTMSSNYELQLINNSLVGATDFSQRFATAVFIMGKYLLLLFAPVHLVFDYSYNTIPLVKIGSAEFFISLIVYIALIYYCIRNFSKRDPVAFGILFFLISMSLVSNVFMLIEATMAERFLYTPSLGFCISLVLVLNNLIQSKSLPKNISLQKALTKQPVALIILIMCVLFSIRTFARNLDWKNNLTLLSRDVQTSPSSARIRYAYGSALLIEEALKEKNETKKQDYLRASIDELEKGVAIIPEYADAWYHLGVAYKELSDHANAVRCFEKSKSYRPFKDAEMYVSEGLAYGGLGKYPEAIADLTKATEMDPKSSEAFNNLGLQLGDAGKIEESLKALNRAVELKPSFSKAYYNMGNTYAKAGDFRNAISKYQKAISIEPEYGDAYNNIGNSYAAMKVSDSAKVYYEKAITIDPSNVKAVINLGITYRILGDSIKANEYFSKARAMGANI